ncbi:MAG: YhbY family RNA-binding protein [Ignavibacteria bacterium]|nr:YhbY family RNA-binding protein [Ignavibacteria bacterium]MCU7504387.1 YhbY family RNA-binding protein [Ignavibacteria bacterium]MCU7517610.1 YhbY family RNA-binding protein [Ignavibacteria bacterium]
MNSLNSKQRAFLRSQAHPLKPVVNIGKDGLTGSAMQAVEDAFNRRELLKVKVLEYAPLSAAEAGKRLEEMMEGVQLVQVIGRIFVLYRPFPEDPKIVLP